MSVSEAALNRVGYNQVRQARRRRQIRIAAWTLVFLGPMLLASTAWQLWGTGLVASAAQDDISQQLEARFESAIEATAPAAPTFPPPTSASDSGLSTVTVPAADTEIAPALLTEIAPAEGEALGRLIIPKANVDHVMVEGVTPESLRKGPGHMPWTPLPGQPGNAVVSGHRTTYGAPFFDVDLLEPGDPIYVETATGLHTYEVREILIVEPTDVWVTEPRPGAWLTLTTCTPKYSADKRLIVFAELVDGPNLDAISALNEVTPPAAAG